MFAEVLAVVGPLDGVVGEVVAVGREEQVAVGVECQAEQIAAALAEKFEPPRQRVKSPDGLLELNAADVVARRAARNAVEPAVRAPGEVVGQGLGVFHAESGEQDLRLTVGHVVAVAVGIKEQVGDLEDVDAPVTERQAGAEIQPGHEVLEVIGAAVAVRVLADGDPVVALGPLRRRFGNAGIDGARKAVHLHSLEPGGVRVLQVLDRPEPAPVVELDEDRLSNVRLGREEVHRHSVGRDHPGRGRFRSKALALVRAASPRTRARTKVEMRLQRGPRAFDPDRASTIGSSG